MPRKRRRRTKFERCVRKVKKKGGVRSPHAVCRAALKKKKRKR